MIESWWAAHEFEVFIWGGIVAATGVVWFFVSCGEAWRERKQKKRDGLL